MKVSTNRSNRILPYFGSVCAFVYAVFVGIQAVRAFEVVLFYYRISPEMLLSFPVIDGKIDYFRGAPTAVLVCNLLSLLTIALVAWGIPGFRQRYLKVAIAICALTILLSPIGTIVGVAMGAFLFVEVRSAKKDTGVIHKFERAQANE